MVRWDSPLFTVPWLDDDIPADDIWKAVTEGTVKPPNAGTQAVRRSHPSSLFYSDSNCNFRYPKLRQTLCALSSILLPQWSVRSCPNRPPREGWVDLSLFPCHLLSSPASICPRGISHSRSYRDSNGSSLLSTRKPSLWALWKRELWIGVRKV